MKKYRLFATLFIVVFFSNRVNGQLKVDQNGHVQVGAVVPNPYHPYIFDVRGNMIVTNYPQVPHGEIHLLAGNNNGAILGTSSDKLFLFDVGTNFNKLYLQDYYRISDLNFKTNLEKISNPLDKIMSLKAYKYDFEDKFYEDDGNLSSRVLKHYGFVSQEIEQALPEVQLTDEAEGVKMLDYDQIIPLLLAGMQEQQKQISKMEAQLAKLTANTSTSNGNNTGNGNGNNSLGNSNVLVNSNPNPFSVSTTIQYFLTGNNSTAEIKVWDMLGIQYKEFNLTMQNGTNQVILLASDLPVSGKYVYALIVDGQIVDAKYVVCNK